MGLFLQTGFPEKTLWQYCKKKGKCRNAIDKKKLGSNYQDVVHLWKTFCLSILNQSFAVLGRMITTKNKKDLERTQQNFPKFVLQGKYTTYKSALFSSGHNSLEERRKKLTLTFTKTSIASGHFRGLIFKKQACCADGTPPVFKIHPFSKIAITFFKIQWFRCSLIFRISEKISI